MLSVKDIANAESHADYGCGPQAGDYYLAGQNPDGQGIDPETGEVLDPDGEGEGGGEGDGNGTSGGGSNGQRVTKPADLQTTLNALIAALSSSKRLSNIPGLEGLVDDPHAQALLASPDALKEIAEALAEQGFDKFSPLAGGASSVVLDAGDHVVRLGQGTYTARPMIPEVIQAVSGGDARSHRWEVVPKAKTSGVSADHVTLMTAALASRGYRFSDPAEDNLGWYRDKLVVLDPGAVTPEPGHDRTEEHRPGSPSGVAADLQAVQGPTSNSPGKKPSPSHLVRSGYELRNSEWFGRGAEAINLRGKVGHADYLSLLKGYVPGLDKPLGRYVKDDDGNTKRLHRPGVDMVFNAPKSVSIIGLIGGDKRVIAAHDQAVKNALSYIQDQVLSTRVWNGEYSVLTKGQDMVTALFREESNRELEPHLHTHANLINAARGADGKWRSIEGALQYDNKMLVGMIYRAELAKLLTEIGYQIEREQGPDNFFHIAGVPQELMDTFSTRSKQIRAAMKEWGRTDAIAAANAAIATRQKKDYVNPDQLMKAWRQVVQDAGHDISKLIAPDASQTPTGVPENGPNAMSSPSTLPDKTPLTPIVGQRPQRTESLFTQISASIRSLVAQFRSLLGHAHEPPGQSGGVASQRALDSQKAPDSDLRYGNVMDAVLYGIASLSERNSAFSLNTLRQAVLNSGLGSFTVKALEEAIAETLNSGVLVMAANKAMAEKGIVTTARALSTEKEVLGLMQAGRQASVRLAPKSRIDNELKRLGVEGEAHEAAHIIIGAHDRFVGLQGFAGTGKTTLMRSAESVLNKEGIKVQALAPQHDMVGRLHDDGFKSAKTVAAFVHKYAGVAAGRYTEKGLKAMRAEVTNMVLFVDEAGRIGLQQMRDLMKICEVLEIPRTAFIGDWKQPDGVEAGSPFMQQQEAGMTTAYMSTIRRQEQENQREAVYAAIDGRAHTAFALLGDNVVREAKTDLSGLAPMEAREAITQSIAKAAAEQWFALSPEERKEAAIIAPSLKTRAAITAIVRDGLKAEGQLQGPSATIRGLTNLNLTKAETRVARFYEPGHVVEFQKDLDGLGIKAGDQLHVVSTDQTRNTVVLRKGSENITWKLSDRENRSGLIARVFQVADKELVAGDKVRWTSGDRENNIKNGTLGVVEAVTSTHFLVRTGNGDAVNVPHGDNQFRHIDHNHVLTTFRAHGMTSKFSVIAMNSKERLLSNARNFYENISRHRKDISLVTDDKNALIKAILLNTGQRTTALETQVADIAKHEPDTNVPDALLYAISHLSERDAVFNEHDLIRASISGGFGHIDMTSIEKGIQAAVRERHLVPAAAPPSGARPMTKKARSRQTAAYYTTAQALVSEKKIVDLARQGRDAHEAYLAGVQIDDLAREHGLLTGTSADLSKGWAEGSQVGAAHFFLSSNDRITAINGLAGVGKTRTASALRAGVELSGGRLLALAPQHTAIKELAEGAGIEGMTVDRFLRDYRSITNGSASSELLSVLRDEMKGTTLLIDESGLLSNNQMKSLLTVINSLGIRAMFQGDIGQLDSVEAGRAFYLLQKAGVKTYKMTDIRRQKDNPQLLAAVKSAAIGDIDNAFKNIPSKHILEVVSPGKGQNDVRALIAETVAEKWVNIPTDKRGLDGVMIIAPSKALRDKINKLIHERLIVKGEIDRNTTINATLRDKSFTTAQVRTVRHYAPGDVVQLIEGIARHGVKAGEYLQVSSVDQRTGIIHLQHEGRTVEWAPRSLSELEAKSVIVYDRRNIQLSRGTRIRWSSTDKDRGILNGRTAVISDVDKDNIHVDAGAGRIITIPRSDEIARHMDYDYARTIMSSQAMTKRGVIAALSSRDHKLINQQSFYVAASRASHAFRIVSDDISKILGLLRSQSGASSTALEGIEYNLSRPSPIHDNFLDELANRSTHPSPGKGTSRTFSASKPFLGPSVKGPKVGANPGSPGVSPGLNHDLDVGL
ncbi:MobF family relaxase [Nitrospirillum amazonense]|uniref:MobF family relaxase n=1 Tax=Nitrospirillum amazonense TaxID=28077 RepID=UPI0024123613|nr:MobF family relaxase [Nitrospirillum amazonense]MDG3443725.1 MobF family relaxase [Nitrospirillum amazonense]